MRGTPGRGARPLFGLSIAIAAFGLLLAGSRVHAAATATSYRDDVLANSPRAYWRLGETSGTSAADELGSNPGTYTNGVLLNQPGALASEADPSASFDGVKSYVLVPASSSLDLTSAATVEFWAKRRTISGTFQVIVGKPGNGQTKLENYAVWLNTSNSYQAYFGDGTTYVNVVTSAVTDTNWHYVVATNDGATVKIYLDGVLKESKSTTLRLTANTNPLNIGRANNNTTFFNGWVDEVAIYPTALSATTIQAHYNKGKTDLIPPAVSLTAPAGGSVLASASVSFGGTAGSASGDSSTVTVEVYSGPSATGTPAQTLSATRQPDNSYSVSATLADGTWTAQAEQQDGAGNTGKSSANTFTVETTAPVTTITGPPDPSNQATATFSFSADKPASFQCNLDGGAFGACTSPKSYSGLADGSHTFQVKATDQAGNTSTASFTWTVDTVPPPKPTISSNPPSQTTSTSATFEFSDAEAGVTFLCQLDGDGFSSCTSPQTYSGLTDGVVHTFEVKARDAAGNASAIAGYTWTIGATALPAPVFEGTPPNPTSTANATFSFSDAEPDVSFECSLDDGSYAGCSSPETITGLADGSHTFRVRARDSAGNLSAAASYRWTIDTSPPPAPTITSNPPSLTTSTSANFGFSDAEAGVSLTCQLDGGGFSACASPKSYTGLADGSHTFQVEATDAAGNTSAPASYTWRVDTSAPVTTLTSNPSNLSNQSTASFEFFASEPSTSQCKLDAGSFSACTSPKSYTGLANGSHTFQVKATDDAGNVGQPASYTWTIDTTPPTITVTSPANGDSRAEWPTLKGTAGTASGDSSTVTVKLYSGSSPSETPLQTLTATAGAGGAYAVIASAPLNPGTYAAQAQQADSAGNTGSSSANTFTVGDPVVLAAGDIAYCLTDGASRTGPLLSREPDALVMPLGDNAYVNGQPEEYQDCYEPTWGYAKARTRPLVGAHDLGVVKGGPPAGTGYLNYFADQLAPFAPTANDPSKLYYSYDLGAWHVVVLNDNCLDGTAPNCDENAQEQWLRDDLTAHTNTCTLVAFHRPRWSSDSVHGNRPFIGAFWNILYPYGVDLVLNGSAHDYERFAPQDAAGRLDTSYGIRQIIVGTGGDFTYDVGTLQPNSEAYGSSSYGVLKLTLHSTSYDWEFIPVADGRDPAGGNFTDSGSTSCHAAPPPPSSNAPSVRAASSSRVNAATSLPLNKPANAAQGDLLLAIVSHQGGKSRNVAPPSGWTEVPNTDYYDATNARIHAYYRIAGASEPASYTFTLTGGSGQDMAGGILDVTGARASAPIDASGGQSNGAPASKSVPAPSITTTVAPTLLVYAAAVNLAATFTPPGQMIEQWDVATSGTYKVSTESATQGLATAGATGTQTAFLSSSGRSVAIMIAIAPAS